MSAETNFATASRSFDYDWNEPIPSTREHHHDELMRAASYNDLFIAPQAFCGQLKPEADIDHEVAQVLWDKQGMDIALGADWHHDAIKLALGV